MSMVLKEVVLNCSTCSMAVQVINGSDTYYECNAIREMKKETVPKCHPAHHIMVYGSKFFIPDICPIVSVIKSGEIYSEEPGSRKNAKKR